MTTIPQNMFRLLAHRVRNKILGASKEVHRTERDTEEGRTEEKRMGAERTGKIEKIGRDRTAS